MIFDLTWLDTVALLWFLVAWLGHELVFERLVCRRGGLNREMKIVRRVWMGRLLERDMRMADSALIGHTIHSISFFASTTMIVVAGLIGLIGALDRAYSVVAGISLAAGMTQPLFELKVLVLLAVFAAAFLHFTWALRQFNYLCAVFGAAPMTDAVALHDVAAAEMAELMTLAVGSFNAGLRAYYFAIAVLIWLLGPFSFLLATLAIAAALLWLNNASPTSHLIARRAAALDGRDEAA